MSRSYRVLALIPARGGSKGILHKNIVPINGKPLIAYTIEAAKGCSFIDRIIVSTDDEAIRDAALEYGADVPFLRPAYLSGDTARPIDVVLHAIDFCKKEDDPYDIVVLLPPTSPLRTADDISGALTHFAKTGCDSLVSVSPLEEHPILTRTMDLETGLLLPFLKNHSSARMQDTPPYYHVNGAIYINYCNDLKENTALDDNECGFLMDKTHSVEIKDSTDLLYCEYLISREQYK